MLIVRFFYFLNRLFYALDIFTDWVFTSFECMCQRPYFLPRSSLCPTLRPPPFCFLLLRSSFDSALSAFPCPGAPVGLTTISALTVGSVALAKQPCARHQAVPSYCGGCRFQWGQGSTRTQPPVSFGGVGLDCSTPHRPPSPDSCVPRQQPTAAHPPSH